MRALDMPQKVHGVRMLWIERQSLPKEPHGQAAPVMLMRGECQGMEIGKRRSACGAETGATQGNLMALYGIEDCVAQDIGTFHDMADRMSCEGEAMAMPVGRGVSLPELFDVPSVKVIGIEEHKGSARAASRPVLPFYRLGECRPAVLPRLADVELRRESNGPLGMKHMGELDRGISPSARSVCGLHWSDLGGNCSCLPYGEALPPVVTRGLEGENAISALQQKVAAEAPPGKVAVSEPGKGRHERTLPEMIDLYAVLSKHRPELYTAGRP